MLKFKNAVFAFCSFLIIASSISIPLQAQHERWSFTAGFGIVETIHAGIEYYLPKRNSIGLDVGFFKSKNVQYVAPTFNHYYFLKFSEKHSEKPTWYIGDRIGYSNGHVIDYFGTTITENLNAVVVVGRKFLLKPNVGFNVDAGGGARFLIQETVSSDKSLKGKYPQFLPEIRFQFFYSF